MNSIVIFLIVFCFALSTGPIAAADIDLSVAASLKEAVTELSNNFAKKNHPVAFRINTGASGALAKQIENGAPCDLYISANAEWTDYLREKKLVDAGTIATFAFNTLVFIAKPGIKAARLEDLVKLKRIAIGSPRSVPAGQYAVEAFRKKKLDKQLARKLVMTKDVRECLLYAERGEVDGAFVYKTDAEIMGDTVKVLFTVPQSLYPRVTYTMALTITGAGKKEAAAFHRFMQSANAKKVLSKYGFKVQ
ncbi:MAG: molybdate ABC transporter substrate-binding protein [Spirochaetes bacterium]|nr:molybdate ABC transporter substrate-binding protein [Spirochaetota bacterium]